jgi:hypothetical protein
MRIYVSEPTVASAKLRSHVAGRPTRFAGEVGCTLSSLKNWLGGYNRPSPRWRQRLATVAGIEEAEWFMPNDGRATAA